MQKDLVARSNECIRIWLQEESKTSASRECITLQHKGPPLHFILTLTHMLAHTHHFFARPPCNHLHLREQSTAVSSLQQHCPQEDTHSEAKGGGNASGVHDLALHGKLVGALAHHTLNIKNTNPWKNLRELAKWCLTAGQFILCVCDVTSHPVFTV